MIDSVVQIIRNCGMRTSGRKEAEIVISACCRLPGCSKEVISGNLNVIEDVMRCSPIASTIFVPMSFFRLSQSLHSNELYAEHTIAGCSLDAARNCVDAPILVSMIDPHHVFAKCGSVAIFRGMIPRFRECVSSTVVSDAQCAESVSCLMNSKQCSVPVSMDHRMFRSKFAQSRSYRVNLPRFSINGTYESESPAGAVQKALDEAFEEHDDSHLYRRKPKEFLADFYLMDPVIASDIVQDITPSKQASIIRFEVGDRVETVSTNGFMGGLSGRVVGVSGDVVVVRFSNNRLVKYDMSQPASAASIRPVRRL
jgi:hypothetical protein